MDELIPLNLENLPRLPADIATPSYQRIQLSAGIVHIGLGNFHRAHQAWYLHRLFDKGFCHDWAIIGAGVRAADSAQRGKLAGQDYLTTLIELDPNRRSAEICGAMIDFLPVEESNESLIKRMAQPDIRIVSLTVTEGGYFVDPASGGFDENHPDILHDVAYPEKPKTAFGAMVAALRIRRNAGLKPFTGMSCDNLQGNGRILRSTVVGLARLLDGSLADWIENNASFPNSMVDCIVPATGARETALAADFGVSDTSPVTHENFRQWVIEDDFCAGRPDLDKVGAIFTDKVHDYEAMKLRILNGGHQIIAMPGELLAIETIADTMAHPLISAFLERVVREEIAPHVAPVPGMTPKEYLEQITRRFSNPEIRDTTRRVAFDGSSRQPGFLFPSIRDGLEKNTPIGGLALSTAMWCRYCEGVREDGSAIEPNDPNWSELRQVAQSAICKPGYWLDQTQYFGDLRKHDRYFRAFVDWHTFMSRHGVEKALEEYLARPATMASPGISRQTAQPV